jgi:hypothetical protein
VKRVVTGVEVEEGPVVVVMARTPSPCCSPLNTETTGPRRDRSVSGLERLAPACLVHSGCASRLLRRALSSETARREWGDLGAEDSGK